MPETVDDQIRLRRLRVRRQLAASEHRRWRIGNQGDPSKNGILVGRPDRRWSSRQLHRLGAIASHAWAGVVVALVAACWVVFGVAAGFPSYWPVVLQSITAVVTVVMLFAIQHLQARDQTVTQRKLDEILRSLPDADNRVIAVEDAPDEELEALTQLNRRDRLS